MFSNYLELRKEKKVISFLIFFVSFFPFFILLGSAFINTSIILISLFFLYYTIKEKKFLFLKNFYFILLVIFFLTLIINIFFSKYGMEDYSRQVGFLRFIIFIFAISFCLNFSEGKYKNLIFKSWFLIFVIVTLDLCFEFIFGFNIFGNTSYMPGRLSGFLGEELKIGNYYFGFFLISSVYLINLTSEKNKLILFVMIFFVVISFMIGERSNFIKVFFCFFLFIYALENFSILFKIIGTSLIIFIISISTFLNTDINSRMKQIYEPILEFGISKYIKTSHYGAHYDTAIKIYNDNKYFGIGLKQFRNESGKEIYDLNENNIYKRDNWATHPHQIHFEILSEGGLFGYISFILFFSFTLFKSINTYFKTRDKYLLSGIIFIIATLIPILPSGSFFTTYTATIFWINYALIVSFDKYENKNEKY